ncbi:MAG: hypothetical protein JWO48_3669 [Bryobacterales bacterium]|nr:hypothetical protein [Bryobacterales bacterium]
MVSKDWLEVAQLAATLIAVGGLFVSACQMYRARLVAEQSQRVADLQALQRFFDGVFEREAALQDAGGDAGIQRRTFNELLTFLEVHASAHNKNLFGSGSEEMVRHKLEDSVIELEVAEAWHPLIEAALDRSTTLAELSTFIGRHKPEINERKAERARRKARESD